jgi:hypothetical protein
MFYDVFEFREDEEEPSSDSPVRAKAVDVHRDHDTSDSTSTSSLVVRASPDVQVGSAAVACLTTTSAASTTVKTEGAITITDEQPKMENIVSQEAEQQTPHVALPTQPAFSDQVKEEQLSHVDEIIEEVAKGHVVKHETETETATQHGFNYSQGLQVVPPPIVVSVGRPSAPPAKPLPSCGESERVVVLVGGPGNHSSTVANRCGIPVSGRFVTGFFVTKGLSQLFSKRWKIRRSDFY